MVAFKHENDAQRFGSQPTRMIIFVNSRNHGQGIRAIGENKSISPWSGHLAHLARAPLCSQQRWRVRTRFSSTMVGNQTKSDHRFPARLGMA